jgi:hypothetical protein
MAIIPNMRIQDNFLFHHTGDALHDQVLHAASLIAVILITFTVTTLTIVYTRRPSARNSKLTTQPREEKASSRPNPERAQRVEGEVERPPHFVRAHPPSEITPLLISLTILTLAITLLLTPLTTILWTHAPELAFLQFPWRLTAILAAVLTLATSIALTKLNLKPTITTTLILVIAAALTYPAYRIFHQPCDEEDTVQARLNLFHSNHGADPTDEYTPTNADNDALAPTNPPYWLSPDPNAKAPTNTQPGPALNHLTVNAHTPEDLILNLRDYPAWHITLNGTPITDRLQRDDGLIALAIPAGPSTIDIHYRQTLDQTLGDILSLASFAFLALFILARRRKKMI